MTTAFFLTDLFGLSKVDEKFRGLMRHENLSAAPISGLRVPDRMLGTRAALFHLLREADNPRPLSEETCELAHKEPAIEPSAQPGGWVDILHEDLFVFKS